jgi:hypothetical protein
MICDNSGHTLLKARIGVAKFTVLFTPGKPLHKWTTPIDRKLVNKSLIPFLDDGQKCVAGSDPMEQAKWILDHCYMEDEKVAAICSLMWISDELRMVMRDKYEEAHAKGPVSSRLLLEAAMYWYVLRGARICRKEKYQGGYIKLDCNVIVGRSDIEAYLLKDSTATRKRVGEKFSYNDGVSVLTMPEIYYRTTFPRLVLPQVYCGLPVDKLPLVTFRDSDGTWKQAHSQLEH